MAIGWYIIPYKRDTRTPGIPFVGRYVAINDYTAEIQSYGGAWTETEVLGNRAIVKVRAPLAVLSALNDIPGFKRLPKDYLYAPLSDLPLAVLTAIRDELLDMGYPLAEIVERFGLTIEDLANYTLYDVLKFATRRRRKPRYDSQTDTIYLDGDIQPVRSIESVDQEITE